MIWFYLDGQDSRDYGLYLRDVPEILSAEPDIEFINVPGRDGSLTMDHGGFKDSDITLLCYIKNIENIGSAHAFMSGAKKLMFSADENRSYRAVFYGQAQSVRLVRNMKEWEMEVPVRLKPFRYFEPEPETVTSINSGESINNPGSAESAPKIYLSGSGDITLMIGQYILEFENLADGVIVDSDKMTLKNMDGITNAIEQDIDEFPRLVPGLNYIQWTGSVSGLTIEPRWRDR